MSEAITITFKVKLQTGEAAEILRLLQSGSFEAALLADVADTLKGRLARGKVESRVVKIEMKTPQPNGRLNE